MQENNCNINLVNKRILIFIYMFLYLDKSTLVERQGRKAVGLKRIFVAFL
jgi:hypothetical protein